MGRGPKPAKSGKAKPSAGRSRKSKGSTVHDLEKRLAEALEREAGALAREAEALGKLQTRDRDLTEALEQQTATAQVLELIASSPGDLQPTFDGIVQRARQLCDGLFSVLYGVHGELVTIEADDHITPENRELQRSRFPMAVNESATLRRVVLEHQVVHVEDAAADPHFQQIPFRQAVGYRTLLLVPMLREGAVIGAIGVGRVEPGGFDDKQVRLLKTFAAQAVIAIENVRLFKELQASNRELTTALEQQTATSEILRVIASSPMDVLPTFEAIAAAATRLCAAKESGVVRFDGVLMHLIANDGFTPEERDVLSAQFPRPAARGMVTGRAIVTRAVAHVADITRDPEYDVTAVRHGRFIRTALSVPMLHNGQPVGAITVTRREVQPFSASQVALLQTFADQAVIAIENVRLFNATKEALERQTATSEILRVISSSPTNIQPVFDAIAESANRLCDALYTGVFRLDGGLIHFAAHNSWPEEALAVFRADYPAPATDANWNARAILERRVMHVRHSDAEPGLPVQVAHRARALGIQSYVAVPMLREGEAIGTITVSRAQAGGFSDTQIALLQTFADQAVIAIENVRLFNETKEALERQTATSEILRVISSSPTDIQPVFEAIVESAARLCDAFNAAVVSFDGELMRLEATRNWTPKTFDVASRITPAPPSRAVSTGRAILDRGVVHVPDVERDPEYLPELARAGGYRSVLAVPLLRDGIPLGAITVGRAEPGPFSDNQIALLRTFADQAVIAIENVRLFNELQTSNRGLTTALDHQTATSEILQVISRSPTDVQPVFDAIAKSALHLCDSSNSVVGRYDGELLHLAAHAQQTSEAAEALRGTFPMRPNRATASGRALLEGCVVHIPNAQVDSEYAQPLAEVIRARAVLAVPMLRDGQPIGTIAVGRLESRPFSDKHIALLQTFADQAVIAIENVRLFTETKEALERQTATSEILSVISRSTTDVRPVFEAICQSSVRLFDAYAGAIVRFDGQLMDFGAVVSPSAEADERYRRLFPRPLDTQLATGQAILGRTIVHIPDLEHEAISEQNRNLGRGFGYRRLLVVPMVRDGIAIGALAVTGREPGRYSDRQIALLQTFADQAVIAIENVRLFTELEARNRDLAESLQQQTATAEILKVISRSPTDIQPVLDAVAMNAAVVCGATDAIIMRVEGPEMRRVAHFGPIPLVMPAVRPLTEQGSIARAIRDCRTIHLHDISAPEALREFPDNPGASGAPWRTTLYVPLVRDGKAIGAMSIRRTEVRPFTDRQVALLQTFADQAVIAIENVRLFKELQEKNRALTEAHAQVSDALERQTATADILRAISQTQTDVQPVFEVIAESAMRLLGAWSASVWRYESDVIRLSAVRGGLPGSGETFLEQRQIARRPADDSPASQTVLTRTMFHSADVETDRTWGPQYRAEARMRGFRSIVAVPMLRGDEALGVIAVTRTEVGGFAPAEIALLQTFADQAVIAVENTRLLSELQARTQELTRSVGELRALGEVGRAVSSTLDLETVLTTIVSRAVQLADLEAGAIYEYDEAAEVFHLRATQNLPEEFLQVARPLALPKGEGATGRLAVTREPVQIPDITAPDAYHGRMRDVLLRMGHRAVLAVPLISEDHIVGGLVVNRRQPGEFAPEVIELLRTFATQSALAIQNARLFREVEDKSRQVEVASQHKSEFLANMSHELRTPLNAIIGFSEVLSEKMFGELNEKQEEYSKDIHASGQHLLSLINDILDLSKIEAGRMELELSDFHLPTALDSALTLVRERAGRRSIALHLSVDERLGEIQADERKVRQVVLNLLSNAIKFTPEGGRIEVMAAPKDGIVEVSVSDTGVGIAPEDQEAVFEEFRQVGTADKKVEGTGLGLTLCRKFIELHGGKIWVKSQLGAGSTFTFTIPVRHGE